MAILENVDISTCAVSDAAHTEHHVNTCQWIREHIGYIWTPLIKLGDHIYWDSMDCANPQFKPGNTRLYAHWGIRLWLWV